MILNEASRFIQDPSSPVSNIGEFVDFAVSLPLKLKVWAARVNWRISSRLREPTTLLRAPGTPAVGWKCRRLRFIRAY